MMTGKVVSTSMLLFGTILISCNIPSHRYFTAHKNPPFDSSGVKIRIDGIYFIKDSTRRFNHHVPYAFFFYSDGSLISGSGSGLSSIKEKDFWFKQDEFIKGLRRSSFTRAGHYYARNGHISIQEFVINPGAILPINTIELVGEIVNDTTVILKKGICYWCYPAYTNYDKDGIINYGEIEYGFYQTPTRLDSTKSWFKRENWYKREVWNRLGASK